VKDFLVQKGIASFKAAIALIKSGLGHTTGMGTTEDHEKWVCSYSLIKKAGYGHTVWCSKREKFGHHARMWDYKSGAFFTGGY
jgi:hypothetical protein